MQENEYKDLQNGIENLINAFGGEGEPAQQDDAVSAEEIPAVAEDAPEAVPETTPEVNEAEAAEAAAEETPAEEKPAEAEKTEEVKAPKEKKKKNKKTTDTEKKSEEKSEKKSEKKEKPVKQHEKKKADKKPAEKPQESEETEKKPASPVKLVVTLAVICAAVALLLSAVNLFTKSQIEENNRLATLESIREIFDSTVEVEQIDVPEGKALNSVFLVMKNGGICGYSATVSPVGFGGPIELMVGISSDGKVVGVDVVSMSETPGLGSKTGSGDFLSQFKGAAGEVKVDAISGATISSKAVAEGVNTVTTDLIDLAAIAEAKGMSIISFTAEETTAVTTKAPVAPSDTTVTTAPETTVAATSDTSPSAPDVSKATVPPDVIVPNPNKGNSGINAEYVSDTTEFETLTTEPESTEPAETAE